VTERRVAEVLGDSGYRLEWTEQVMGNSSPAESPLMDAIRDWAGEADPEAIVVPTMLPAFTDSRSFRAAFPDVVAYGFFPHKHMTVYDTWPLIHSADERIDVRDLGHAARFFRDVTRRLLG
jgi:acetylornithine deacetylase/succinyl-diaminopimelate desuccinylase-like protein